LGLTGCDLVMGGRHEEKLVILQRRGINARLADELPADSADVVVDCTGHPSGFAAARGLVKPRGTLVLKSTFHGDVEVNLSMLVVDEITLVGSRCGPFAPALRLLERGLVDVESLISATYHLDEGLAAFEQAQEKGTLKVLLDLYRNSGK
jgi:threonine dehydrogenase-like Zn-dependent dehydrogenase